MIDSKLPDYKNMDAYLVIASHNGKEAKAIFVLSNGMWDKYDEKLKQDTIRQTIQEVAAVELGDVPYEVRVVKAHETVLDGVDWGT